MADIPQPSNDVYSVGDRVKIYIGADDPDSQYHGVRCEVVEVQTDDLGSETGRTTDGYSYMLREVETDEELPISFRHRDLVPVENNE
ncbi:hypothetical protein OB920_07590 [Halobacteria archaeon HArc-gm2]|nr:hypothetical protein [Halobacteria archaeon HArc-gm2]